MGFKGKDWESWRGKVGKTEEIKQRRKKRGGEKQRRKNRAEEK